MMILNGARQVGKTYTLIEAMKQDPENSVLVCRSDRERERNVELYATPDSGLSERNFATVGQIFRGEPWRWTGAKVYVDDLDHFLQTVFGRIAVATATEPFDVFHRQTPQLDPEPRDIRRQS